MPQGKNKIKDQIISAANQKSVNVVELDVLEGNKVRAKAIAQFAKDDSHDNFIWSNLPDRSCVVCRDENSWLLLDSFIQEQFTYVFFNKSDSVSVFKFSSGSDLISVLDECSLGDFYIVDESFTFFITYSHHDILTASGTAIDWLEKLTNEEGNLISPLSR